ncbi:MAG: nitroreductase, partial [Acidimicrobiales bacterium]|nr:nitroreductase [Acidimicrobiales bacterium]
AYRTFAEGDVPDDLVNQILDAATFAPSAENRQPWVFVVVRDEVVRAEIGQLTRKAWEGGAKAHSEGRLTPGLLAEVDQGATGGIGAAPVIVVVCGDTTDTFEQVLPASVFPAVQNMLLAATALDLGSALTTLTTVFGAELAALLGLPDHVRPMAVVPLGWPAKRLGPPRRTPFVHKTHRDRYGRKW